MWATIVLGTEQWLPWAAAILVVAVGVLLWGYLRAPASPGVRTLASLLKVAGLALLALCLLEPLWSGEKARPGANIFLILADNSQSLEIREPNASQSRGEHMAEWLTDEKAPWLVRLNQDFDTRQYLFAERVERTRDFAELRFDGQTSGLHTALTTLRDRYRQRPLAGVLLLTDGNATDWPDDMNYESLPPIYPVVAGNESVARDVSIESTSVSQTAFEDAPVTVRAEVLARGCDGQTLVAQLLDEEGKVVQREQARAEDAGQPVAFRFRLRPPRAGVFFYRLRTATEQDLPKLETGQPDSSSEATWANNTQWLVVDRGGGPYRILYVSGRPNWEFKFLRRALDEDEQVNLVGLIRIAKREPKFDFRGRQGESSNPLFRGFKPEDPEETERYDQPVLVRLGTESEAELRDGFPKRPEDLYRYHAVVLDDLEAEYFTRAQMLLVERFVSERGGGFLMLSGQESFRAGKYERTPIADLLPVYLDAPSIAASTGPFQLQLSRDGWLQPWVRLRDQEEAEQQRLADMPEFRTVNRVRGIKPGASILATVQDQLGNQYPGLVAHRYGRGRAAALTIGDLWRWGLRQEPEDRDLEKSWRQTLRWLVADVPERVELQVESQPDAPSQPVRLQVQARDEKFAPLDNATATVTVRTPTGEKLKLDAEPSLKEAGLYEATYVPHEPGAYLATVKVRGADGKSLGAAAAGWTSDPAAEEFRSLSPHRARLEELAARTGGEVIAADGLEAFARGLPNKKMPVTERTFYPLWHQAFVFLLAIFCLAGEWGLRRWRGLP